MTIRDQYDDWHRHVFGDGSDHRDQDSPWYRLVLEYLNPNHLAVLEVGCGRGGFVRKLESLGASVTGTDFSAAAVEIARTRSGAKIVQADATELPFIDQSFDAIVCCEVIEHLPDPRGAIREMYRVCRSGGTLYLTTPNYVNMVGLYEWYANLRGRLPISAQTQPIDNRYFFFEILDFFAETGWNVTATDGTVHQLVVPGRSPMTMWAVERNRTIRKMLRFFALTYLIVARRS